MFILSKCLVENIYSQTLPPQKKRKKEKEKKERKDSNSSVTHSDYLEGQI